MKTNSESMRYRVNGLSMSPVLLHNDIVLISSNENYSIGDVIVFYYKKEGLLIHRILEIHSSHFICKGDNAFRYEMVTHKNIIGKVIKVIREFACFSIPNIITPEYLEFSRKISFLRYKLSDSEFLQSKEYLEYYKKFVIRERYIWNNVLSYIRNIACDEVDRAGVHNELTAATITSIFRKHKIIELLASERAFDYMRAVGKAAQMINMKTYKAKYRILNTVFENVYFPYAIIKGYAVAKLAYRNIALRNSIDVDILVEKKNVELLHNILTHYGFRQGSYINNHFIEADRISKTFMKAYTHQTIPYILEISDPDIKYIIVDINYELFWGEYGSCQKIVQNALSSTVIVDDEVASFKSLDIEYMLVHLCMHLYKDSNSLVMIFYDKAFQIRNFLDIYLLVKNNNIDLQKVQNICKEYNIGDIVFYAILYTSIIFCDKKLQTDYSLLTTKREELLSTFGLSKEESHEWHYDCIYRLFQHPTFSLISNDLTNEEIRKIQINAKFYQ